MRHNVIYTIYIEPRVKIDGKQSSMLLATYTLLKEAKAKGIVARKYYPNDKIIIIAYDKRGLDWWDRKAKTWEIK